MKDQKVLYSAHPTSLLELSFPKLQLRMIPVVRALVTFVWSSSPRSLSYLKVPDPCRERWNVGIPTTAASLRVVFVCTLEGKRDEW